MKNNIAICTVIYNEYEVMNDFIKSLDDQQNKNFHLFIADLSTKRHAVDFEKKTTTYITGENLGYAHGINLCIKEALRSGYENFVVINNDTYFKEDFVGNIISELEKYPHSILGGKIYYAKGYEYHKDRYQKENLGKVIWYAGGNTNWDHVTTTHHGVDKVDNGEYDKTEETDFITGCLMCYGKEIYEKVGRWDESYFLYYEDSDYCERAKRKGIQLLYDPHLVLWHKNSASTGGSGSSTHVKYQTRNRLKFGLKYAPLKTKLHLVKNAFLDFIK